MTAAMSTKHTPGPITFDEERGEYVMEHGDGHISLATLPALFDIARRLSFATDEGDDKAQGTHYVDQAGAIRCKGSFLALIEEARAAIAKATGSAS